MPYKLYSQCTLSGMCTLLPGPSSRAFKVLFDNAKGLHRSLKRFRSAPRRRCSMIGCKAEARSIARRGRIGGTELARVDPFYVPPAGRRYVHRRPERKRDRNLVYFNKLIIKWSKLERTYAHSVPARLARRFHDILHRQIKARDVSQAPSPPTHGIHVAICLGFLCRQPHITNLTQARPLLRFHDVTLNVPDVSAACCPRPHFKLS